MYSIQYFCWPIFTFTLQYYILVSLCDSSFFSFLLFCNDICISTVFVCGKCAFFSFNFSFVKIFCCLFILLFIIVYFLRKAMTHWGKRGVIIKLPFFPVFVVLIFVFKKILMFFPFFFVWHLSFQKEISFMKQHVVVLFDLILILICMHFFLSCFSCRCTLI